MSLSRHAKKRDATEAAIIQALKRIGAQVIQCDTFDLLVIHRGHVHMLECKTGKEPLTASQQKLIDAGWPLRVVRTPEDAVQAMTGAER